MKRTERVFGLHAVSSLLQRAPARVSVLLVLESRSDTRMAKVLQLAEKANVPVRRVSRRELDELVAGVSHQGVVAETGSAPGLGEKDLPAFRENTDTSMPIRTSSSLLTPSTSNVRPELSVRRM